MEQKVHIINSFVGVPMPTEPSNIVCGVFDGVKPFFCACIHCTLIKTGEERLHRLMLEWAGMGEDMLEAEDVTFFHDLALAAQKAMEGNVYSAMEIFADW